MQMSRADEQGVVGNAVKIGRLAARGQYIYRWKVTRGQSLEPSVNPLTPFICHQITSFSALLINDID